MVIGISILYLFKWFLFTQRWRKFNSIVNVQATTLSRVYIAFPCVERNRTRDCMLLEFIYCFSNSVIVELHKNDQEKTHSSFLVKITQWVIWVMFRKAYNNELLTLPENFRWNLIIILFFLTKSFNRRVEFQI